jgi:hypothetical protein
VFSDEAAQQPVRAHTEVNHADRSVCVHQAPAAQVSSALHSHAARDTDTPPVRVAADVSDLFAILYSLLAAAAMHLLHIICFKFILKFSDLSSVICLAV